MTDKITNKITKIVLTGGPCAGKTTAMAQIIEHFSSLGFQVFAIPEVPTMFSSAGINYLTQNKALFFEAEKSTLNIQLELEDHFAKMAAQCSKPVLIVCDRGTMDISAYVSPEIWEALTEEMGTNTVKLRDARYEAILHMVTAAAGAEQFYTNENNKFRSEDVEMARELDRKVLSAWTGHPHLRVIGNHMDFEDKLRQVLNEISTVLGVPSPIEKEHKYIVEVTGDIPDYTESEITQTYLLSEPGTEMRVRKRGWQGSYVYFQTIKKTVSSDKQIETERSASCGRTATSSSILTSSPSWVCRFWNSRASRKATRWNSRPSSRSSRTSPATRSTTTTSSRCGKQQTAAAEPRHT